jgi:hypothetical protein
MGVPRSTEIHRLNTAVRRQGHHRARGWCPPTLRGSGLPCARFWLMHWWSRLGVKAMTKGIAEHSRLSSRPGWPCGRYSSGWVHSRSTQRTSLRLMSRPPRVGVSRRKALREHPGCAGARRHVTRGAWRASVQRLPQRQAPEARLVSGERWGVRLVQVGTSGAGSVRRQVASMAYTSTSAGVRVGGSAPNASVRVAVGLKALSRRTTTTARRRHIWALVPRRGQS